MYSHGSFNRIYRLVWSALHQTWVVASELAGGRGKSSSTPLLSAVLLASLACLSGGAGAAPQGGQVVGGSGSISASGSAGQSTTTITQASDKLSINWQSFNVAKAESVNFVQPSASALAVNRIFDTQGSQILGRINANGQVWLINPNGVLFGKDAQINVGGLVASTLNPDDASIGSARSNFSGNSTAGVVNLGSINTTQGGYVALLGHSVSNQGSISAPGGTVALGAGSAVSLNFAGSKLLGLEVTSNQVNALAENGGLIQADGGQVLLSAGARDSLLASVVNNTGIIRADSVSEHNGKIVLSGGGSGVARLAGALSATGTAAGQTGGTVQVLGDKVLLAPGASIDASGHSGGGTVLVGGDYQGSNASVQNASRVYVASDTSLKADAIGNGDGGKVVVWADGDTRFAGSISARGGAQGGNGGFVEVSGKQDLNMQGQIDVAAPHGTGGNVLLDPENIVLSTAANNPGAVTNQNLNTPDLAFADAPASGTYTVNIASVTGFNELFLQATNDITVNSAVAMGAGNSIRLEANNNIVVNAGITVTGAGSMNLRADADSSGAGGLTLTNAALSAQAGGITLRGASVTGTGTASTISSTGAANGNAGNISITADTGSVALAAGVTANGGSTTSVGRNAGTVAITAQTGITTAAITASGTAGAAGDNNGGAAGVISLTNNTSGNITTAALTSQTGAATGTSAGGAAGSISVTNNASGGNVTTAALTTTGGTKGAGGNITVSAAGVLNTNGTAISSSGGAGLTSAGANAGNIILSGGTVTLGQSVLHAIGGNGNGTSSFVGGNGGAISVTSNQGGMTGIRGTTGNLGAIRANGGNASSTGAAAGGAAGTVTLTNAAASTGAINLTSQLEAKTGVSVGTTAALAVGSITVNNHATAATATTLGALFTDGGGSGNGNGGHVNITTTGTLSTTGISATGGTVNAGSTLAGRSGGNVTINTGGAITALQSIFANGSAGVGANQAGGAGGVISVTTVGGFIGGNPPPMNASGGAGSATDGAGGAAGSITVVNNSTGAIALGALTASAGAAGGTGAGGTAGSISVTNNASGGNVTTAALTTTGAAKGAGGTAGNVTLSAGGAVTQTGAIAATGLALTGTGGAYTLNHASNAITTLAANTGSINYTQSGALAVDTVGAVSGVTTTGITQIETTSAAADLTLNNAVTSGATGDAVILKAASVNAAGVSTGGQLINNVGTGGIVASSGRYLAYSGDPGSTTEGVTGYAKRYNADATFVPSGSASTFIYRIAPTLAITANAGSKVYDGAEPTLTFGTTGLIDGDTAGTALTGALTRSGGKNVLGGDAVTIGTLAAQMGYGITYTGANYSITPKALSASGTSAASKTYDGNTLAAITVGTLSGLVNSETVTASASGTFDSPNAGSRTARASYTLVSGSGLASNYSLADTTHSASINKKALTYTADAASFRIGTLLTGLTGKLSGFVNQETQSTATTGTLAWVTPATSASGGGSYAINGSGLLANNYSFSQAEGNAAALTLTQTTSFVPVVSTTLLPIDISFKPKAMLTLPNNKFTELTDTAPLSERQLFYLQGNGINLPNGYYQATPTNLE